MLDSALFLSNMAVGGYASGDVSTGAEISIANINASNTYSFIHIDDAPGNLIGKHLWLFHLKVIQKYHVQWQSNGPTGIMAVQLV